VVNFTRAKARCKDSASSFGQRDCFGAALLACGEVARHCSSFMTAISITSRQSHAWVIRMHACPLSCISTSNVTTLPTYLVIAVGQVAQAQLSSDSLTNDLTMTASEVNFNRLDGTSITTLTAITDALQSM
jgi:hypothetical protein